KPFVIHLHNNGPDTATGITATIDLSGLDAGMVDFSGPDGRQDDGSTCTTTDKKLVCSESPNLPNGGNNNSVFLFVGIVSIAGTGDAGSFTVDVTSGSTDPNLGNNKATVPVKVVPGGFDLIAVASDVYADPDTKTPVKPGEAADFEAALFNFGTKAAKGG